MMGSVSRDLSLCLSHAIQLQDALPTPLFLRSVEGLCERLPCISELFKPGRSLSQGIGAFPQELDNINRLTLSPLAETCYYFLQPKVPKPAASVEATGQKAYASVRNRD